MQGPKKKEQQKKQRITHNECTPDMSMHNTQASTCLVYTYAHPDICTLHQIFINTIIHFAFINRITIVLQ